MKKQHVLSFWALFLIAALFLAVANNSFAGTRMPAFALEDVRDGKVVDSKVFKGKVLLLSFFATWCPPCIDEVPIFVKLQDELYDSGFSVVGLSVDQQNPGAVEKFVQTNDINYPVLLTNSKIIMDFGGVYGIPVTFLVNRSGNVVKKYMGPVGHGVLEKDIRSLLN